MHRMRVTYRGQSTTVGCPDDLEREIREYQDPPHHLVAWAVIETVEPNFPLIEGEAMPRSILTDAFGFDENVGIQDLIGSEQIRPRVFAVFPEIALVEGGHEVEVELLDMPEVG